MNIDRQHSSAYARAPLHGPGRKGREDMNVGWMAAGCVLILGCILTAKNSFFLPWLLGILGAIALWNGAK